MKKEIEIIAELSGQFGGNMRRAEQMILQCKMAGANAVKVQLYDTYKLPGENREKWEYLSLTYDQVKRLKQYADLINIDFFASVFDKERLDWCIRLNIKPYKIASMLLEFDFDLCETIVDIKELVYCSLGKWNKNFYPFENEHVKYFHCLSIYPHTTQKAFQDMPMAFDHRLVGYSDHSLSSEACYEAVRRGATIIEKHFTTYKNLQSETEGAHVCSWNYNELLKFRNWCDQYTGDK